VHSGTTAWNPRFAVDGSVPYLMDAAHGQQSIGYLTPADPPDSPVLILDLQDTQPISRIHLHAIGASDTLPQAFANDYGIPQRLRIDGAQLADFSDAVTLLDLQHHTIYDIGSIMMWPIPETRCRYIRFTVVEPATHTLYGEIAPRLGFAEIEIFANGRNIALGKTFATNVALQQPQRPLSSLTDGRNMYGDILPIRDWLNQLVLRHQLETERPLVLAELNRRYIQQKSKLRHMGWLATLLAAGTIITILVNRIIRQRALFRAREQIAADLHDELGANIHAIGLWGDLARSAKTSPEKMDRLLPKLQELTERTSAAARYCTDMLEAKGLYEDLVDDMRKSSARIMADLDYRIEFQGEEFLSKLKPRKRIDLFLFYKECLINIIRHSEATHVAARLTADANQLRLIVEDNGFGLNGEVPSSLKRRARLLGGHVTSSSAKSGGTQIALSLKLGRKGVLQ
jgi:signal transduction histidine kinase